MAGPLQACMGFPYLARLRAIFGSDMVTGTGRLITMKVRP